MIRILKGTIIAFFICILCLAIYRYNFQYDLYHVDSSLKTTLQTGDLFFSEGRSFKSDIVRLLGNNRSQEYSHTGFVLRQGDSISFVHMSIDDGIIMNENIETFIQRNHVSHIDFYRINRDINTTLLTDILHNLLNQKIKFDYNFDLKENNTYYCTELIYNVLRNININISIQLSPKEYLYPEQLANNSIFIKL